MDSEKVVKKKKSKRNFMAKEDAHLIMSDSDEEALTDEDYHCSELETETKGADDIAEKSATQSEGE